MSLIRTRRHVADIFWLSVSHLQACAGSDVLLYLFQDIVHHELDNYNIKHNHDDGCFLDDVQQFECELVVDDHFVELGGADPDAGASLSRGLVC